MRLRSFRAAVLFAGALPACAQSDQPVPVITPNRGYQLLRENDDWTFLRDPTLRSDFWDPIKYIPLRAGTDPADDWYLSIGGEVRQVWERIGNDNWGQQPYINAFWLQRYMVHVDTHYGKHVRSFVQLKSGLEFFRQGEPRPIDEKKFDFEAAFLELGTSFRRNWIVLKMGRQELNYGSGRLLSVREGPNVRQSFDGFKIRSRVGAWNIDGFAVRPDLDKPGFFSNAPDHATAFWGLYATRLLTRHVSLDAYYLGIDRKQFTYDRGTAQELRQSVGARLWRPVAKESPAWDFDYEGVWQFGTFGTANIRAWTVASDTGYSLPTAMLKPRFSLKADISSGDDPRTNTLGTFSPIYPVGNYFGVIADTGPGPVNFIDVHPRIQTQIPHGVSISADLVLQWRENVLDGVYAVPGFLIRPADDSRSRFVGYRPGVEVRWQIDHHAYVQADYGVFYAGRFLRESMPGRNLNYLSLWAGYKF
jgi:hypothetical protein